jgi:hypothetical protein
VAKINIIIGKCKELRENKKAEALSLCLLYYEFMESL